MWVSVAGFIILFNGTPLSWSARKLRLVPQSSTEAETASLCNACKAMMFVRNMFDFMLSTLELPIHCFTDNEGTRLGVRNPGATQRTKHYELYLHYSRKLFLDKIIEVNWVGTNDMIADIMTKPLDKTTFLKLRNLLVE